MCLFADDISAVGKILGKEVTLEDGKQYMRTEKMLVDFSLGKSRFRIRDYINDGNVLGKNKQIGKSSLRSKVTYVSSDRPRDKERTVLPRKHGYKRNIT
jgi:hypothetical protein